MEPKQKQYPIVDVTGDRSKVQCCQCQLGTNFQTNYDNGCTYHFKRKSLGRYIPKYFILSVAMVNGIVSLISLSVFSLLVYRNASLQPNGLYSPWNPPGHNTGVGSLSLLQEIFPTQGSNLGLPHCRQILYQLSPK